jgi:hypothetical protein
MSGRSNKKSGSKNSKDGSKNSKNSKDLTESKKSKTSESSNGKSKKQKTQSDSGFDPTPEMAKISVSEEQVSEVFLEMFISPAGEVPHGRAKRRSRYPEKRVRAEN